jgi:hypothetical protein
VAQTRFGRNNCEGDYQQIVQSELRNRFALEKDQLEVVASQVQQPSKEKEEAAEEEPSAVQ